MTARTTDPSPRAESVCLRRRALPAAPAPRGDRESEKLIHLDPHTHAFRDLHVRDLPSLLGKGDLLIVNDAATMPASLRVRVPAMGNRAEVARDLEVRLLSHQGGSRFRAVLFGEGDYLVDTDRRPAPPRVAEGMILDLGAMSATVIAVSPRSAREMTLEFDRQGAELWSTLYAIGRPIQYSHVRDPLPLWAVQTSYAARPWAMEMPSAGRPLTWNLLFSLAARGVTVRALTHAAGISATGDPSIDRALPLPERFDIPERTVAAVAAARAAGGRVIAVGTSVTRALEGSAARNGGVLVAGTGTTDLILSSQTRRVVVDGLLTGMHDDDATSHFALLRAFAPEIALERAFAHAASAGYVGHELGDSMLILAVTQEVSAESFHTR